MTEELVIADFIFRQRELGDAEVLPRVYDAVIAGLSWESRGLTALSTIKGASENLTLFRFKSSSEDTEREKSKQLDLFREIISNVVVKELEPSTHTEANFKDIKQWIQDLYQEAQKPISILIDITCIPKTYVLYLIGMCFSDEMASRIDCLYTPGVYEPVSNEPLAAPVINGPHSLLSEGEWRSRQVPYLEADTFIADSSDLLVTLGGEFGLALPFIERFEPTRLGLICIEETSPSGETAMLDSERIAYQELLNEPNVTQRDIKLCDAISVAQHTLAFTQSDAGGRGTTLLAIGSKPHALGLALAALADPQMEVVCRTPGSYRMVDARPSARPVLYEIEDRFDPMSYISPE